MLTKDDNGDGFRLQLKIQLDGSFRRSVIAASEVAEMTHAGIVKHCCEVFQDALPPGCLPTIKFQDDEGDFCDLLPTTTSVADLLSCAVRVEGQPDLRRLQLVLAVAAGSGAGSVASAAAAAAAVSDSAAIAALVDSVSGNQASVAAEVPSAPVATPDAVGPSTSTAVAAETEDNNKISSTSPISTSTAAAAVDPRTIAPRKVANTGPMLPKGFIAESKPLNEEQLEKMRYEHFAGSGRRKRWQAREVPLTDDELECWLEQSRWLTCSVTGKRWLGSKSIIGVGLYHAPRFLSDEERERQAETSRFVQQRDSAARAVQASRPITSTALADDDIDSTEELFHVYPSVQAPPPANIKPFASASAPSIDTRVGSLDVIVGPVFDIDAFNDGAIGNPAKGILPYDQRGVVDMDRQFNALNMAYYVAKGKSIGTAQRYERKMITNRLSFYIEEFHGRKVFPDNVEAQLALLVHRDADAFDKCVYPVTRDDMIADAVKRCIPKILKATVASMLSDKNEADSDRFDQALRVYLLVHQMAIKLVVRYSGVYSYLFRSVLQWIQNPFTAKSRKEWPDIEEVLISASLVGIPWSTLRESFVRRLMVQMMAKTANMRDTATSLDRMRHMFNQNRTMIMRLLYELSFFVAGATPSELDVIYSRCAGSLPKAQRDAVKRTCVAVKGVDCMEKLWKYLAMDSPVTDDLAVRNHIGRYLDYLVAAVPVWEAQNLTADAWNAIKVPPLVTRPIVQKSSSSSVTSSATSKPNASSAQSKHSSSTTVKAKAAATSAAPGKGMGKVAVEAKATRTIPVPQQTVSSVATLGILGFQSEEARLLKEQDAEEQMKHMGWPMLTSTRTLDRNKCCYPRCGRVFSCRSLLFHHLKRVFKGRLAANPGFHVRHRKLTTEETHPDHDAWRSLTCPACHCSFENGNQLRIHYTWLGVEGFWSMEQQTALRKAAANESQEEQEEADMDRIDERQVVNEYVVDIVPASPSPGAPGTHAPVASESTAAVATTQVRSETVMVKSTPLRRNAKEEEFDLLGVCIKCLNAERECIFSPCGHFVACRPCSERAGECPVCRTMVFDFIVLCYGLQSDGRMRGTMAASPRYWVSRVDRTVPRNIGTPDTTPISQLTGMALREVELDATKVAVFQLLMSRTSIAKYMPQDVTSNARYSGFVVKKVFRIENPYLWRSYAHAKHMIRSRFVSHFETKNSELGEIDKKLARVVKDFNGNPEAARDKMNATLAQLHRLQQLREKFEVTTENLCLRDHFAWKTATKGQAWSTDVGWLGYAANDSAPSRPENLTRRQREEIEEAERRYIRMREGVDEEMLSMRNPSSMHYLPEADRKLHSDFMQELALESDINEKVLFHGTDVQYADSIKHNGLDERLSSDYGLFGGGIYFAENATKSDAYCVGMGEKRFMFLSRVCLGTPFVALSALDGRRPPCLELCDSTQPCTHSRYDSVIGEKQANNQDAYLMKHREFVVYDRNQVYPEFMIIYERV